MFAARIFFALLCSLFLLFKCENAHTEKLKIGISVPLSGDAASYGEDLKNGLLFANKHLANNQFELIIEDDRCDNKTATAVANKFVNVDKVNFALGFACNSGFLTTAKIYDKAGIPVVTSCATSGDVDFLGSNIFRLFPSDVIAANLLADFIVKQNYKKIFILTELNEYPVLMDRSIKKRFKELKADIKFETVEFLHRDTDFKSILSKVVHSGADAIFLNSNTDASFITVYKQLKNFNFSGQIYGAYIPASDIILQELGSKLDGVIFPNLPLESVLVQNSWSTLYKQFKQEYGASKSGLPLAVTAMESLRLVYLAVQAKESLPSFLKNKTFTDGIIPSYSFDQNGAVQGFPVVMQKIIASKIIELK